MEDIDGRKGDQAGTQLEDINDLKATISRDEHVRVAALEGHGLVKSPFDTLSIAKTVWVFRTSILYCLCFSTAGIFEGFELSMSGSIVVNKGFVEQFGELQGDGTKKLNNSWLSAWGAILNVGQIVAITVIPQISDNYGRKKVFYIVFVLFVASMAVLSVAKTPAIWFLGKVFLGLGIGSAQLVGPVYQMELAPNRFRGGTVGFTNIWGSFGGIMCSLMLQVLNQKHPYNYLLPLRVVWGPIAAMGIVFVVLPESPWNLARRGKRDEAIKSMRRLFGNIKGYDFDEEYAIIERTLAHEKEVLLQSKELAWAEVFRGLNRKRLVILIVLCCSQQFGGNALIGTYGTFFFATAGLKDPFLGSLIQSCIAFVAVCVYAGLVDKVGRRIPINSAFTFLTLLLWLIGGVYYTHNYAGTQALLAFCCLWQPCFSTFGSSYSLLAGELPPAQLRMKIGAASWFTQAILGIISTFAVPQLLAAMNVRAAFVYAAFCVPCGIFLWYSLPETKGRSVAEIDELFLRKVPAWRWANFKTAAETQLTDALEGSDARYGRTTIEAA